MGRYRNVPVACGLCLLLAFGAGCGGKSGAYQTSAEGTLTLDGVPLPGVWVQFVPEAASGDGTSGSGGLTDDKGFFRLSRMDNNQPGAAVGVHRVVVSPGRPRGAGRETRDQKGDGDTGGAAKKDPPQVPKVYEVLSQTPLRVEVTAGQSTYDLKLTGTPLQNR